MTINQFIPKLKEEPTSIVFSETMEVVDKNYDFTPTQFTNGELKNEAEENNGSCKVFAFAEEQNLTKEETLYCFGEHYQNVLDNPDAKNHQNIRNFMEFGFDGLQFEGNPLTKK
ncbi:HopJ type III effector protein [Polaribacter sp.]|nr:HopJ type III effector protein [Polaribacter sp.]